LKREVDLKKVKVCWRRLSLIVGAGRTTVVGAGHSVSEASEVGMVEVDIWIVGVGNFEGYIVDNVKLVGRTVRLVDCMAVAFVVQLLHFGMMGPN
jgi:hypothetical protein